MTTEGNLGSQRVLLRTGFQPVAGRPEQLEVNGLLHQALHFERTFR